MSLENFDPHNSALIVVDMQNAFCRRDPPSKRLAGDRGSAGQMITRIVPLARRCQDAGIPVIWTVREDAGTWEGRLVDPLDAMATDPYLVVPMRGDVAFRETLPPELLSARKVESLLVTGVSANRTLETIVLEFFRQCYNVVTITDVFSTFHARLSRMR